jgi:hypothetical protein
VPEPVLPRPGAVVATQITGQVFSSTGEQPKPVSPDARLRVGSTVSTGRRSLVTLALSNGTTLQLGSESELEVEEFGQATFSERIKVAELKEEPTISRTRLRLVRGDVGGTVKRLNAARGSSFTLTTLAGTLRMREGTFRTMVQMSDLGLGVCTLEVPQGVAEFQPVGSDVFQPVPVARKLAFEQDKATGAVKLSEMPQPKP